MGLPSQLLGASVSWLRGYQRERLPPGLWGPLALLVATAGAAQGPHGPLAPLWGLALQVVLVAQLRLWDDIADLPADQKAHPKRVLSQAPTLLPYRVALGALGALAALLLLAEPWRLAGYGGLLGGLWLWYRARPASALPRALGLLLKYPAMALLGAAGPWATAGHGAAAAALYGGLCAHEILHDERLRGGEAPRVALLAAAGLVGLAAVAATALVATPAAALLALSGSANVAALLVLGRRWRRGPLRAREARGALWACWSFELLLALCLHFGARAG